MARERLTYDTPEIQSILDAVAGKQDIISDLETIRSGAASGASAYQKPSGGIPKTDMDSAVAASLDDVSTKENSSNKVTAISSSSTDAQYPSAKCVYDIISGAVYLGQVVETV